ncbi:hypothetical protein A8L34_17950 [Bacillus sp. FJAT-27264]|uniref:hypothetical protein n=1 Tax=Paenibacillus sp. (strain DSM 101736 / FJAT-27264) TaxID=1850362 RepID=UPI000807A6EF|nr:hypothetical protein [Bacillus sp. FJAT-27264]OBZ10483.1 hypothetical protein A8L34_17950 [Bacillus sp. FJAT-27264]
MTLTIIVVGLCSLAIAAFELPPLIKKGWAREILIFIVMLVAGAIVSIVALKGIQTPSPMRVPELIYKPLYRWMQHILQVKDD